MEFDQIALAQLENGDYCRLELARDAPRVAIQFGAVDPANVEQLIFEWRLDITAEGIAQLQGLLATAAGVAAERARSLDDQKSASLDDAKLRIAELQKELVAHGEKELDCRGDQASGGGEAGG